MSEDLGSCNVKFSLFSYSSLIKKQNKQTYFQNAYQALVIYRLIKYKKHLCSPKEQCVGFFKKKKRYIEVLHLHQNLTHFLNMSSVQSQLHLCIKNKHEAVLAKVAQVFLK